MLLALLMSSLSLMAYDPCDFMVDGIAYRINADGASVSVTYTAVPDENNGLDAFMTKADREMYADKTRRKQGRRE